MDDNLIYNDKMCRICLESDDEDDLFSPCVCTGSNKFVHRKCLSNWRVLHNIDSDNFNKCDICKTNFLIKVNNNTFCFKCCNYTNQHRIFFFFIIFVINNFILSLIFNLVSHFNISNIIHLGKDKDIKEYAFSVIIFLSLMIITFIINDIIFFCKNKKTNKQYITKYYDKFAGVGLCNFLFVFIINCASYFVVPIAGIIFTSLLINVVSLHIFECYIKKNNVDMYEVLEYNI